MIGIQVQGITRSLADGLGLNRTSGVIVADVAPDTPAALAGVHMGDVIASVNGRAVANVPTFADLMNQLAPGDRVTLTGLRGGEPVAAAMTVVEAPAEPASLADIGDPVNDFIQRLGVVGVDVDDRTGSLIATLREASGVLVTVREESLPARDVSLEPGDVIHGLNGLAVRSVDGLRVLLDGLRHGSHVVLQIERGGRFRFVITDLD
jgi:serine protease Do